MKIAMMGPSPAPAQPPAAPAQGFPLSQTQMIALAIVAVAYFQRARLGRNGLIAAVVIAAALVWNERRQKASGYCPNCKR
jgi:drug/metabolite transporter (DMT)-like permease